MPNTIDSLEKFITQAKIMKAAIPADLSIAICDLEKFLVYFPAKNINLAIQKGQRLHQDEPLAIALKNNQRLQSDVPEEFYGFAFTGTATPLHNAAGQVIGGVAVQFRKQSELMEISDNILNYLGQATNQVETIANGSSNLNAASMQLINQSQLATETVRQTDEILQLLKHMANQTNLLGLNAAIEAARAGEAGEGFNVVANEIRRFSKDTIDSTERIRQTMREMQNVTAEMTKIIEQISMVSQEQSQAIYQTSDFIKDIEGLSVKLNTYAKQL